MISALICSIFGHEKQIEIVGRRKKIVCVRCGRLLQQYVISKDQHIEIGD
jgi:hypothetical protein